MDRWEPTSSTSFSRRTAWPVMPTKLAARLKQLRREGAAIYDLTESNPTKCGFLYDEEAIRFAISAPEALEYDPDPRGSRETRKAIAAYYEERGVPIPTDRVIITSGSSEAYSHLFRLLCEPGDEVLAPQPSYPLFDFLADMAGITLKRYPLRYDDGWDVDVEALAESVTQRTRAILTVNPNNPTGSVLTQRERDKLVRLCLTHDLALISDEVFLDYLWEGGFVRPVDSRGLCPVFGVSGLSKLAGLPQMKLGWITIRGPVGPDADAAARLEVMGDTFLSVSTPTQIASRVLLEQRNVVQPQIKDRIARNLEFLDAKLGSDTPVSRLRSAGGWYAVLRVPASLSDEEWALFLLETASVHAHPGELFGFGKPGYLVISLITPHETFREGLGRLVEAVR